MNRLTKKTALVYLAAVFTAGLLAGGVAGFSLGKRMAFAPPPRPQEMAAHMCDHLRSRLHLTPEQVKLIEPVLNETAAEIESVHSTSGERIAAIFQKSNQRIAHFLTPEQKVLQAEMERERQQFFHRAFRGPPRGPPPPGHDHGPGPD